MQENTVKKYATHAFAMVKLTMLSKEAILVEIQDTEYCTKTCLVLQQMLVIAASVHASLAALAGFMLMPLTHNSKTLNSLQGIPNLSRA